MKLLSLSEFKRLAEIGDTTDETVIVPLIEWVSAQIELSMARWLKAQQYIEVLQPTGPSVWLKAYPLDMEKPLVVVDYGTTLNASDYYVDVERGKITRIYSEFCNYGYPTVSITYTGGYPEIGAKEERHVEVPDPMQLACFLQCAYYWRNRKELGVNSMSLAGTSVSLAPVEWLPAVKDIIQHYKRHAY